MMDTLFVSKLDVARRELDTAIDLFLNEGDPISIHTVTAAAHQVLMDIGKARGVASLVKETLARNVLPEKRREYLNMVSAAENYFKHANRDPRGLMVFKPEATNFLLLDAVNMYKELAGNMTPEMFAYAGWFFIRYPYAYANPENIQRVLDYVQRWRVNPDDKSVFRRMVDEFKMLLATTAGGLVS